MTVARTVAVVLVLAAGPALAQQAGGGAPAGGASSGGGAAHSGGGGFIVTDGEAPSVYGIDSDDSAADNSPRTSGNVPPVHVVRKGDTLWDICKGYFGNPWQWPKVWSYNPNITNPHWIFPGDQVRLTADAGDLAVASNGPVPAPASVPEKKRSRIQRLGGVLGSSALAMRELGFVEQGELNASAKIVGSREEKLMLSSGDQAYLEYPGDRPLHVGERYTIYKVERDVVHPVSHERVGYVVLILGEVQIDQVTRGDIARATIVDSNGAIERGYRIGPLARRWRNVEAKASGATLEAFLVAGIRPQENIESDAIVFVDKGRKDGVNDGNRFFVVRRGDGYRKLLSDQTMADDPRYPKEVVAELVVVETHDRTSVAYVSKINKELHPGDRMEMRRGY
jgi:hypothetical protein